MTKHFQTKLNRFDGLLIVGLISLVIIWAIVYMNFSTYPFEDAAMLMRYAKHVAQGQGIVWNIGEKPNGGVTDFLFMVFVAALAKAGLSLELSVRLIVFISHILTAVFVYLAIRTLHGSSRWIAFIPAAYLAVGPGLWYVEAYFGTPFFTLFVCLTWWFANKLEKENNRRFLPLLFALTSFTMGLIRPEGVFLAIFIMLSILYGKGFRQSRRVVLYFLGIFIFLGGFYLFWRWSYSGYPLPNSFYIKGGGHLYLNSLIMSIRNAIILTFPFSIIFIYALIKLTLAFFKKNLASWRPQALKQTIFPLIPLAGFVILWVLLSNAMNHRGRFQYPILPIVLISYPPLLKSIFKSYRPSRALLIFPLFLVAILSLGGLMHQYKKSYSSRDGRYDVAVMLKSYSNRNYTMAITESGLLPFYSEWKAVDAVGLHDQWIAHHGPITEDYLDRYSPEIIMFHAFFSPIAPPQERDEAWHSKWHSIVRVLKNYAEDKGYILASSFGLNPHDTHYYYVKPDFLESAEIARKISSTDYFWWENSKKCINYAR